MAEWVKASTGDRTVDGSSPTSVKTFLFGTLAIPFGIPFTLLCQCLSDKAVKAVGPFYLVSMPGEVKIPPVRTGMCRPEVYLRIFLNKPAGLVNSKVY